MTDKLLCPFCGKELDTKNYYVHCHNPHCNKTVDMEGNEELWQALIDTKGALNIAIKTLKFFEHQGSHIDCVEDEAFECLDMIKSLGFEL